MTRVYRFCGACGVHLQRLDHTTDYWVMAQGLAERYGVKLTEMKAARLVHTALVHYELEEIPPLVDAHAAAQLIRAKTDDGGNKK